MQRLGPSVPCSEIYRKSISRGLQLLGCTARQSNRMHQASLLETEGDCDNPTALPASKHEGWIAPNMINIVQRP